MLPFSVNCPLPKGYDNTHSYTTDLCNFIQHYRFLTNIHVVDFLTQDQWELLDPAWRQALLPDGGVDEDSWWDSLIHLSTAADLTKVINAYNAHGLMHGTTHELLLYRTLKWIPSGHPLFATLSNQLEH
jgi:hypothetical protein